MSEAQPRYRTYSSYLKETYGKPAYRVGVDGGFSCPNRAPDGSGGCSYCDETGSVAAYQRQGESGLTEVPLGRASELLPISLRRESVRSQILRARQFLTRRYRAELFLLYFQAFSGTFGSVDELREIYDDALSVMDFTELIVATRPDCISPAVTALLASYKKRLGDVWVELGLQSALDSTLERINRGHTAGEFSAAFRMLREAGIRISVHLILGLPGEGYEEISRTAAFIAEHHPEAVKLHNIHVPIRTRLYDEYTCGEFAVSSARRHRWCN